MGKTGQESGGGSAFGHTFGVRVDGAAPRGLWPPVGGRLCRRVVKGRLKGWWIALRTRRFLGLTGLRAGGFLSLTAALPLRVVVSPLWAMNIKSALRDLLSVPYGMISILVISRYAAPPLSGCAGLST